MSRVETGRGELCKADAGVVRGREPRKAKRMKQALEGLVGEGAMQLVRPTLGAGFRVGWVGCCSSI